MNIILIALLCCIISIIILIILLKKKQQILTKVVLEKHDIEVARKEELKSYFEEEWKREEQQLNFNRRVKENNITNQINELENQYKLDASKYTGQIQQLEVKLKEKEKRYEEVNQDLDLYREGKMKEIDGTAAEYEQRKRTEIERVLKQAKLNAESDFNNCLDGYMVKKEQLNCELKQIKANLEEERTKRAAINEEILRRRALDEQQDFYRIQMENDDELDIKVLRSILPRLKHPEAVNKAIWTGYYQKPLAELRKRLLPNGDISGIYKLTRIRSNEIYIGQSTSIDKRWQEHVKTALGVGNLASSLLHKAMKLDGPENFTFEVLEEVPKDKLRERESYYIDFYDSKTYGLNSITGDKNK